jgi:hypothetical protein
VYNSEFKADHLGLRRKGKRRGFEKYTLVGPLGH